jgi:hypothetical protein
MAEKTQGNQMNRSPRLHWHLRIPRNMMIRVRQQRSGGIAVKKPTMIRMDRRFQQVWEQPTDHPDTRRKQNFSNFNRTVNEFAVQQPADRSYACANQRVLLCVRHPLIPPASAILRRCEYIRYIEYP